MNFGSRGKDFASDVWHAGHIGIWYGSWLPEDLVQACDACRSGGWVRPQPLADELNRMMSANDSSSRIEPEGASASLRFEGLEVGTWVFTYFDRAVHLAQIAAEDPIVLPQFAYHGETFKAKLIQNRKTFRLGELPPSFLLLPSAGRGNVHKVPSCSTLLELLRSHDSAADVSRAFDSLQWDCWISALGPKGWEALCLGFLIQEYGFLPTGLSVGGTLAAFDIVGRLRSGESVYAQCKGTPTRHPIASNEEEAFASVDNARKFFFARSGVSRELPGVTHLDQAAVVEWLTHSDRGIEYLRLLRPTEREA
jgi:hypothetical protein